ncbi:MAG: molybdopterin-dependent oxidoreductase [Acidimicrobiia bacterium]|nr:molybdopterin-dependent oxidoreductase [Acidimicrobiia bacterium]
MSFDCLPVDKPRWIGQDVPRKEDRALLTGRTRFIDDVVLPEMLHCAILRSLHPHARIVSIDTTEAEAMTGVVAVVTGADVLAWSKSSGSVPRGWGSLCLATEKARFVGEPVAAVAAASRAMAEDALECIAVEYEPLEPVTDPFAAMAPGSPLVMDDKGTNVMLQRELTWGEVDAAFAAAAHVFTERFRWHRVGANPTETFGAICEWDPVTLELIVHGSIQSPGLTALGPGVDPGDPAEQGQREEHAPRGQLRGKGGGRGMGIAALLSRKGGGPARQVDRGPHGVPRRRRRPGLGPPLRGLDRPRRRRAGDRPHRPARRRPRRDGRGLRGLGRPSRWRRSRARTPSEPRSTT